ncbi:MAG: recombinase family protein [Erysipelotrichaceae bacterium]
MEKVFIYIRVSTEKQVIDGNGLDMQRNELVKFCRQKNYEIVGEYIDKGKSALKNRPQYNQMIEDVFVKSVKRVVAYKRDRLIRDVLDLYEIILILTDRYHCVIETVKDGAITMDNANETFLQTILSAKDRLECQQVSERTIDCLKASAQKGNYTIGRLPLGYRRCIKGIAQKHIEPNPIYIDDIKQIFELVASKKMPKDSIVNYLNKNHFCGVEWYRSKLDKLIKNKIYIGAFETTYFIKDDFCKPIVNQELWEKANYVKKHVRPEGQYLFRNMVYNSDGFILENKSAKSKGKIHYYYYDKLTNM